MDKATLRRRIAAVEFSMWELHLFLDTHPDCEEAVEHRLRLMAERKELLTMYESRFGDYYGTSMHADSDVWSWVDDPWPWDLEGGVC